MRHSSTLSLASTLDEVGCSTPRSGRFTPGKETPYRNLGGPHGQSRRFWRRKISSPYRGSNPEPSSLQRLANRIRYSGPLKWNTHYYYSIVNAITCNVSINVCDNEWSVTLTLRRIRSSLWAIEHDARRTNIQPWHSIPEGCMNSRQCLYINYQLDALTIIYS